MIDGPLAILAIEALTRRNCTIRERDRSENRLHRGTGLEGILHRGIVKPVVELGRISADVGYGEYFAGERVEHDGGAAFGAALFDLGGELGLGERLDRCVDRELELSTRLGRFEREGTVQNRVPERVVVEIQGDRLA